MENNRNDVAGAESTEENVSRSQGAPAQSNSEPTQAYLVFDSKAMQSCSLALVDGMPVLLLSNTKEQETNKPNVAVKPQISASVQEISSAASTSQQNLILQAVENDNENAQDDDAAKDKLYFCQKEGCGQAFSSWNFLREHLMYKHETQRSLPCTVVGCDRVFSWPAHLKYHEKTHVNDRTEVCPLAGCGRKFYTGQRLRVHMRTHTGEKPFSCEECGKCFTTAGNLKNHIRTHTGEKPFECSEPGCQKQFAEKSSLRKHQLVHTKDKPYSCDICGRTFTQQGSRNVHMKKHARVDGTGNLYDYSETVAFANASTDHVETVTTQPAEGDLEHLNLQHGITEEDFVARDADGSIRLGPSTGANVVVLSQPEEIVSMAPGLHMRMRSQEEETSEEVVYDDNTLLCDGTEFDHEEIASHDMLHPKPR